MDAEGITPALLFEAAAAGDPVAAAVIGELVETVAIAVTAVTALLDPARVILDGSIGRALAPYLGQIGALVGQVTYRAPEIVISTLGPNATVIGAIASALALHRDAHAPTLPDIRTAISSPLACAGGPASQQPPRPERATMFLSTLRRRNPGFLRAATALHADGSVPANSYVLDLDAVTANARVMSQAAAGLGLTVFAMTKQAGRNPHFCAGRPGRRHRGRGGRGHAVRRAVRSGRAAARAPRPPGPGAGARGRRGGCHAAGLLDGLQPGQGGAGSRRGGPAGRVQDLLLRIHAPGDTFYLGHEGGFAAADVLAAADDVDSLDGARCAGITTFPALLFSAAEGSAVGHPQPRHAACRGRRRCAAAGRQVQVNAPGTTSSADFAAAGRGRGHPGRARARPDRHHPAARRHRRPARAARRCLRHRGVAQLRRPRLLLRRRPVHRPGVPRLPGAGAGRTGRRLRRRVPRRRRDPAAVA